MSLQYCNKVVLTTCCGHNIFKMTEANSQAAEELFVEIFNDKESFVELLVQNIKKADDVEQEMCRGQKRLEG